MNMIEAILSSDCVLLKQKAASKKVLLEQVCHTFVQHEPTLNPKLLFKKFIERERLGSTDLDHGVAIPHVRIAGLAHPMACFIHLDEAVTFNESQGSSCDLILSLIVPEDCEQDHLNLLAFFAQSFHNPILREQLRTCCNKESIISLFAKHAEALQPAA